MTTNNWREEFDKHFGNWLFDSTDDRDAENQYDNVCDFIETQIAQARREGAEEMKNKAYNAIPLGMTYYNDLTGQDYREGYNQGVDDSRNSISSLS